MVESLKIRVWIWCFRLNITWIFLTGSIQTQICTQVAYDRLHNGSKTMSRLESTCTTGKIKNGQESQIQTGSGLDEFSFGNFPAHAFWFRFGSTSHVKDYEQDRKIKISYKSFIRSVMITEWSKQIKMTLFFPPPDKCHSQHWHMFTFLHSLD